MPLRDLRLARFGDNMRDVAVTEGDKVETQLRFGVSVYTYGVNDLVTVVDSVTQEEIDKFVAEYADLYRIAPELHPGGERHDALRYGARIEAGLRTFLEDGGFGAFTPNFEDLGGLRQLPGLGDRRRRARRLRRDDRDRDRGHRRGHHARSFQRKLRWSAAYHRLAAGI